MKLSEAEFQKQVVEYARLRRWAVAHFRKVRVQRANGSVYWETPVAADGKGFPDLVMARSGRLIAAELKVGKNVASAEQVEWLDRFEDAGVEVFVWYPNDWHEIKEVLA